MKTIIRGSHEAKAPSFKAIYSNVIAEVRSKYGKNFPLNKAEVDAMFEPKKAKLEKHISVSFVKKTDKFRDMMLDLDFDIDGYQAFKGIWLNAINSQLSLIEKAFAELPEKVYLCRSHYSEQLYILKDMSIDLEIGKYSFNESSELTLDDDYSEGWQPISMDLLDALGAAYGISNLAVDTGSSNEGFGNLDDDAETMLNNYGLRFVGDWSNYYSTSSEELPIVVMELTRATSIDEIKANYKAIVKTL